MKALASLRISPEPNIRCSHSLSMDINEDQNLDPCHKTQEYEYVAKTKYPHCIFLTPPPHGISRFYQLDQSIYLLRAVGLCFIQILIEHSVSKRWRP